MNQTSMGTTRRTPAQIKEHYKIEKELANRLRNASKQERNHLYSSLYDELYRRVPHHPQLTRKRSTRETEKSIASKMQLLRPFITEDTVFVEVGAGDCSLAYEVAKHAKEVYAVDVSEEISKSRTAPNNFQFILSDGCTIPLTKNSADVAYSNQLMEHLHPDDAFEQLQNIYDILAVGGRYICITPNSLTGPHDISKHFDSVATGFHLKEYTASELSTLFKKVGFSRITAFVAVKGKYIELPIGLMLLAEHILSALPSRLRKAVIHGSTIRSLLNIRLGGIK